MDIKQKIDSLKLNVKQHQAQIQILIKEIKNLQDFFVKIQMIIQMIIIQMIVPISEIKMFWIIIQLIILIIFVFQIIMKKQYLKMKI